MMLLRLFDLKGLIGRTGVFEYILILLFAFKDPGIVNLSISGGWWRHVFGDVVGISSLKS